MWPRIHCVIVNCFEVQLCGKWRKMVEQNTVVTAPVDVDATSVGAGELRQGEAGWVCWEERCCKIKYMQAETCKAKITIRKRKDLPQKSSSSERSPQSSSRSQIQEAGMHRPLAHENWFGGHVRAGKTIMCKIVKWGKNVLFSFTIFW